MLAKSALFLEIDISRRFSRVIVVVTSVASASSASFASSTLKTELTILDRHIYLCVFR